METVIKKWGNSLALRIPMRLANEVGLEEDSAVELLLEEGRLVIVPLLEPTYALADLLAGISPENLHGETDSGEPQGGETW